MDKPVPKETLGTPFAFKKLNDSLNSAIHTIAMLGIAACCVLN